MRHFKLNIRFYFRIIIPAIFAILLFILAIFFIIIPHFQNNIMNGKREMINELTNSAWSILSKYEQDEKSGLLSRKEAQETAVSRIQYLRYGEENKDYFWITDMHPTMVMHPYRPDLNGQDLSNFEDPHGKKMFVEFVNTVKKSDHGFVDYMWQWKDDSLHIVPKLSYVRVFEPWDWVIGTGIYIEDVNVEIKLLTRKLVWLSSAISLLIAVLLLYISKQSINIEQKRIEAKNDLNESREKYKTLVEATTEGLIMIIDGKISFANSIISKITGFSTEEIEKLRFRDLISQTNRTEITNNLDDDYLKEGNYELSIKKKNGDYVEVFVTSSNTKLVDKEVNIVIVKDITHEKDINLSSLDYQKLLNKQNIGFFRARLDLKGKFVFANETTIKILGLESFTELSRLLVADFFIDTDELKTIIKELNDRGFVRNKKISVRNKNNKILIVSLTLLAVKGEKNDELFCDGTIEDISESENEKIRTNEIINRLNANAFLIHQKIGNYKDKIHTIDSDIPISQLIREMSKKQSDYFLLSKNENDIIGIITSNDILERIYKLNLSSDNPAYMIMSSPVISISEYSTVSDGIKLCTENKLSILVIKDANSSPVGVFDLKKVYNQISSSLSLFESYIQKATTTDELKNANEMLKVFIKPLIKTGISTEYIIEITSSFFDTLVKKLIELAFETIGTAPVNFAFVCLGSEGRKEETLFTDQDNAIIYDLSNNGFDENEKKGIGKNNDLNPISNYSIQNSKKNYEGKLNQAEIHSYFIKLGNEVCTALNEIGYSFCKGKIMANNEQWCQPFNIWKQYFKNWINSPEPQNLVDASIFFDLRTVFGDTGITNKLRSYVDGLIIKHQAFLYHMAQNTYQMKIPQFSSTNILSDKSSDLLDIKPAVNIIVLFARTYALQNNIRETNTIERLKALCLKEIISEHTLGEILFSYNFLMALRLKNQVLQIENKQEMSNVINTKNLLEIEISILKKVLSHLSLVQTKVSTDFRL